MIYTCGFLTFPLKEIPYIISEFNILVDTLTSKSQNEFENINIKLIYNVRLIETTA